LNDAHFFDHRICNVYVLLGAFEDGDRIVPVKLEVKSFSDMPNSLHVAIALENINKGDVLGQGGASRPNPSPTSPLTTVKIAQILSKINPADELNDGHFFDHRIWLSSM